MRLLIVDDDAGFLTALEALLGTLSDVEVVGRAENGREGVDLAVELQPDVVVMDLDMPQMDGVTATRAIRQRVPAARVVILSGSDVVAHAGPSMAAGATAYVRKTNTADDLPTVLASLDALRDGR